MNATLRRAAPPVQFYPGRHLDDRQSTAPAVAGKLTASQLRHLCKLSELRERYTDGEPIVGADARYLAAVLSNHPRAAQKIGPGVRCFTVHQFAGNRAFFVVRTDGTSEDFSARWCVLGTRGPRSAATAALMARFNYRNLASGVLGVLRRRPAGFGRSVGQR